MTADCQKPHPFLGSTTHPHQELNGFRRGKNDTNDTPKLPNILLQWQNHSPLYPRCRSTLVNEELTFRRDVLFTDKDKKYYQSQIFDQKRYMTSGDFRHKDSRWNKVIGFVLKQINANDAEIDAFIIVDSASFPLKILDIQTLQSDNESLRHKVKSMLLYEWRRANAKAAMRENWR